MGTMSVIVASIITNINPVNQPRDSNSERHTQTTFVLELQVAPIYTNHHPRIMVSGIASLSWFIQFQCATQTQAPEPTSTMLLMTDNYIITVFSTCIIPRFLGRAELRTSIIPYATRWTKDCYSQESCCGPEGQGCECTTKQHQGGWRRWKQQHNAE